MLIKARRATRDDVRAVVVVLLGGAAPRHAAEEVAARGRHLDAAAALRAFVDEVLEAGRSADQEERPAVSGLG